jgi:hypothetical protein
MNFVLNEYLHESLTFDEDGVHCEVYIPIENIPVVSLCGTIYFDEVTQIIFDCPTRAGSLCFVSYPNLLRQKIVGSNFCSDTGRLILVWDKRPDYHEVVVSYEFAGGRHTVGPLDRPNWLQEGF